MFMNKRYQIYGRESTGISIAISTLHCIFLFVVFCVAVFTGWGRRYEGPDGRPVKKEAAAIEENYVHES